MTELKKVALVTVNFGKPDDTLDLLKTVRTLDTKGLDFKMVVVDKTPDTWIGDAIPKDFPDGRRKFPHESRQR